MNMTPEPKIHRFPAKHEDAFVNAYLVKLSIELGAAELELTAGVGR
jgi:hypothetical protein